MCNRVGLRCTDLLQVGEWTLYTLEGPKFGHSEAAFWDMNFKLLTKKQKTQKEVLTLTFLLPKKFRQKNLLQEAILKCWP